MKTPLGCTLAIAVLALTTSALFAQKSPEPQGFEAPKRLMDGDHPIRIESPGYAAPCWADVNGDGKSDLLVGQFRDGKIKIYPGLGQGRIGKGQWLEINGKPAKVPGVW